MARGDAMAGSRLGAGPMNADPSGAFDGLYRLPREQVLGRLRYALKRPLFAMPFYGLSLSVQGATSLAVTPTDPWPGNAEVGGEIIKGVFTLADRISVLVSGRILATGTAEEIRADEQVQNAYLGRDTAQWPS